MNKLTLQALALTGILAVSGLPALAADMAPATPAPSPSVSTDGKAKIGTSADTKANVGSSVDSKAKTSIDKNAVDKNKSAVEKNVDKSKSAADKNVDKSSKNISKDQKKVEQTAAKPVPHTSTSTSTSVGADHAGASAPSGATVQH